MPVYRRIGQGNVEAFPFRGMNEDGKPNKSNLPGWGADWNGKAEAGDYLVFQDGKVQVVKAEDFQRDYELVSHFSG